MSDLVIEVESLSKRYSIGRYRHDTLRDQIMHSLTAAFSPRNRPPPRRHEAPVDGLRSAGSGYADTFWALRDVSFAVKRGEVLGIIGRNGAGKSTLLKILARVTRPSAGRAWIRGRLGSLLEVGTGFHPELTGRENIFLNGAVLGMKKREIARKFDDIVDFAEIERFLDTPVKRYSTGMYMRLAFSVAAHLEPDILIVDEVLAVGDGQFQRKCLGKMDDAAKAGRTVLFVSHNLGMIQALCNRAILLRHGTVLVDTSVTKAVATYLRSLDESESEHLLARTERRGQGRIRLFKVDISAGEIYPPNVLMTGQPATFTFHITALHAGLSCAFTIYDEHGQRVTYFDSALEGRQDCTDPEKGAQFFCEIDELPLLPARYRINAAITCNGELQDHLEGAAYFDVEPGTFQGRPISKENGYCSVFIKHRWTKPWKN